MQLRRRFSPATVTLHCERIGKRERGEKERDDRDSEEAIKSDGNGRGILDPLLSLIPSVFFSFLLARSVSLSLSPSFSCGDKFRVSGIKRRHTHTPAARLELALRKYSLDLSLKRELCLNVAGEAELPK